MADFIYSLRDGVLTVVDGTTPTALEAEVLVAEGDLKITTTEERLEILDRGTLHEIKKGDEVPMEWAFSARFTGYGQPTGIGVIEAVTQTDGASAWVGTRDATSDVYCFDLKFELKGVDGNTAETVTLTDCYLLKLEVSEGDPNMVSVSGRSWATFPTIS